MLEQSTFSLKNLWGIKPEFRRKVFYLALTFLFMLACQVMWRPLKMAIFSKMVGAYQIPNAKLFSLLYVIPLILLYSKLVDWLRRHQLVYCFTLFHAIGGLIFAYFMAHPVYGIANTTVSSSRYVGWAFYFFMESFDAFVSMTFWSFADSINKPSDAKNYYGFLVAGSKIGGMLSAGIFYIALSYSTIANQLFLIPGSLVLGSLMLGAAAFSIYKLMNTVSDDYMHGYEAAYKLEKAKVREKKSFWQIITSPLDGLFIMIKNPYVLGIFSMVFFYEMLIAVLDWWLALSADKNMSTVAEMTAYFTLSYFFLNLIGFVVSLLGTTPILRLIGIRPALFLFPIVCLSLLFIAYCIPSTTILFILILCLRSINYAFNHPTREILYIPTTKDIKFKAKTWTDAFGSRIAKSAGSGFNIAIKGFSQSAAFLSSLGLGVGLSFLWIIIVYFLGRKFQHAIDNKQVIGQKEEDDASSQN